MMVRKPVDAQQSFQLTDDRQSLILTIYWRLLNLLFLNFSLSIL